MLILTAGLSVLVLAPFLILLAPLLQWLLLPLVAIALVVGAVKLTRLSRSALSLHPHHPAV